MAGRLAGKVCLITGTGGTMGRVAALTFAREGARIVGCDVDEERAQETVEAVIEAGGEMISMHPLDLTDPAQCAVLAQFAVDRFGGIDVLFNNAAYAWFGRITELAPIDWQNTMRNEADLVFYMSQAAWPHLARKGGAIVNTASANGWVATRTLPALAHSAAKGAVIAMTRQLAMEGSAAGIRANSISPGPIETNQTRPIMDHAETYQGLIGKVMLARFGQPQEVINAACFLASDEASYITGADLRVDGGLTAW